MTHLWIYFANLRMYKIMKFLKPGVKTIGHIGDF